MVQSNHLYPRSDPKRNIVAGTRERSYCVFQIHSPDWDSTAQKLGYGDYRFNLESCIQMAYHIYKAKGYTFTDWTTYNKGMHLAYLR